MKKILIVLLVLFILAAAGIAVFALTFDADRYRPMIVSKIEESTGFTVALERISLGWEGGLALKLNQMAVYLDKEKQRKLGEFDSLSVLADLTPLLNRRLEVGSIVIKNPDIQLVRGPDGKLRGFEKFEQLEERKANTGEKVGGAVLLSAIRRAEIENGRLSLLDQSGSYVTNTTVEQLDLTVKDFSLAGDVTFKARAAFASSKQNIQISGRLRAQPLEVKHVEFETDLEQARLEDLFKMFPALKDSGLQQVRGRLSGVVDGLKPEGEAVWDKGEINFSGGRLQLAETPSLENLELRAELSPNQLDLRQLSGNLGEGNFSLTGKVDQVNSPLPLAAFKAAISGMNLSELLPSSGAKDAGLGGKLSLVFEGTAAGKTEVVLSKSVSGQGQLDLENGVIRNLNVLREVFNRLSMIPGLVQRLQQRLPPAYQEKLQARDTYLQPVQLPFTVNQGVLSFNNLNIAADSFALAGGQGSLSPQFIRIQAVLLIDAELSTVLAQSVAELSYLQDREGRLSIPVIIQGPPSQISALPDLQYVASKLAMSKTQEVLTQFLSPKKANENSIPVPAGDPSAGTGSEPVSGLDSLRKIKGSDLLAQFLGGASSGQDSSGQQQ